MSYIIVTEGRDLPHMLPSAAELAAIKAGDIVKVIFRNSELTGGVEDAPERMWVIVHEVDGDQIKGQLDSPPCLVRSLQAGSRVSFPAKAVIDFFPQ